MLKLYSSMRHALVSTLLTQGERDEVQSIATCMCMTLTYLHEHGEAVESSK